MRRFFWLRLIALLPLLAEAARGEVILQYFGTSWNEIERRLPELAERGYDSLWLPPPFKAGGGTFSVGFDTLDRFDLGDRNQSGTVRTRYGTKADLVSLMRTAHRLGLRVYFDNVMAHNAGPLDKNTGPGELFPGVPGFVPEDFHIVRQADGQWRKPADWPNWNDEWQVLNRNPFAWDIAQEVPDNVSFNPNGTAEGHTYPKWTGVRHPGRTEWYLDTELTIGANGDGQPLHPFADKEPFEDVGYEDNGVIVGTGNGRFDFKDLNGNGQHDVGEPSEPFEDTGVDPTVPWRRTAQSGYGDGKYNMGNPVPEDVNQMLFRAVRWFIQETKPDGFRLDAVKHVPSYFFGKQDGADKDRVNWGYNGQIQEQFNISRGFSDWNNHRDTVFSSEYLARDDAMLFGEHLGSPPAEGGYLNAGMRIANDNLLNSVNNTIGFSLAGYDQPNHGGWGSSGQTVNYVMSHDNNSLWGGNRPLAHAYILTREGLPVVYTDGYNQAGGPDFFPKPSGVNFVGQFGDNSVVSAVAVHRDFARGFQIPRWSDQNFAAYERVDNRENKDGGGWNGRTMLYMMARSGQGGQARWVQTGFPHGATLVNQSSHGGRFRAYVNSSGQLVDGGGNPPIVPAGGWFAFTWHDPRMPLVWRAGKHKEEVRPISIYQNGLPAPEMDHWRVDGKDGDPAFNPYGMPAGDTASRSYRVRIPRVTDGGNLKFVARSDGSAGSIRLKLNGGVDINSHLGIGPQTGDLRDFQPGINTDRVNAGDPADRRLETSTDTYLGYEQMTFVRRTTEKFAARNTARNVIGSPGAETYQVVIGTAGVTLNNGGGFNSNRGAVNWVYHNPEANNESATLQMSPPPEDATGAPIDLWVKVGYQNADKVWIYYTTDGATFPEGSSGVGKGSTQVVEAAWVVNGAADGGGTPAWWKASLPPLPQGAALRYKIGVARQVASRVFPFSNEDIDLAERMETVFEIADFNATAAPYHVHNDYGEMATGLEEGFHVLRSRAFVHRTDGSSIFRTETQVFYYDTSRPGGEVVFPKENDQLGGSSFGAVVVTDPTVTEVWYSIEDMDPSNDNPETGNGTGNWQKASAILVPGNFGAPEHRKEWRFTYTAIPASGQARILVRLMESSSSMDMDLNDEDGHFTTLERNVTTGSSLEFSIGYPSFAGELVDENYRMKVYFRKELIPAGMSDHEFLAEFSIYISSITSGSAENPVLQPRSSYELVRDATAMDHAVEFLLPNLYNGIPDFLHTVIAEHRRGALMLEDRELVTMRRNDRMDGDGDGLPDWWERYHGLDPESTSGPHGGNGDFDLDGISNLAEYLFGMNPAVSDASSLPRLEIVADESLSGGVIVRFPTLPDRLYQWQVSENLNDWDEVGDPVSTAGAAGPGFIEYEDTESPVNRFYRVVVSAVP